jgi:hypothetical protein
MELDLLDTKTDAELIQSVMVELAKSKAELNCARADINKITSRIGFLLVVVNKLIDRQGDR